MNRASLFLLLSLTLLAMLSSFWRAPYPSELKLQHVPTAIGLVLLGVVVARDWLPPSSVICLLLFLWLHILGARWIYSFVPYDHWFEQVLGSSPSAWFGWQRNHYDRLVHLASGVLFVPPIWECVRRQGLRPPTGLALLSLSVVLAIGAVYEIVEWIIAVVFAPDYAEAYNGQQGDIWDPQKDLALAGMGALMSAVWLWRRVNSLKSVPE